MATRAGMLHSRAGGADKRLRELSYTPRPELSEFAISSQQQEGLLFNLLVKLTFFPLCSKEISSQTIWGRHHLNFDF